MVRGAKAFGIAVAASDSCSDPPASSAVWPRIPPCCPTWLPFTDAGTADTVPAEKLRNRRARLVLLQSADNLFVREMVAIHSLVLSMGQSLL